jgi:hypothetical protein
MSLARLQQNPLHHESSRPNPAPRRRRYTGDGHSYGRRSKSPGTFELQPIYGESPCWGSCDNGASPSRSGRTGREVFPTTRSLPSSPSARRRRTSLQNRNRNKWHSARVDPSDLLSVDYGMPDGVPEVPPIPSTYDQERRLRGWSGTTKDLQRTAHIEHAPMGGDVLCRSHRSTNSPQSPISPTLQRPSLRELYSASSPVTSTPSTRRAPQAHLSVRTPDYSHGLRPYHEGTHRSSISDGSRGRTRRLRNLANTESQPRGETVEIQRLGTPSATTGPVEDLAVHNDDDNDPNHAAQALNTSVHEWPLAIETTEHSTEPKDDPKGPDYEKKYPPISDPVDPARRLSKWSMMLQRVLFLVVITAINGAALAAALLSHRHLWILVFMVFIKSKDSEQYSSLYSALERTMAPNENPYTHSRCADSSCCHSQIYHP